IPSLQDAIAVYETIASAGGSFLPTKVVGIALNTYNLMLDAAKQAIQIAEAETQLPCTDVVRFGAERLLDAILEAPLPKIPNP
ncbi:MAG: DUF1611 domain-containing protein, partial [Cyanobacteria bacterium J06626_18]